MSFCPFTMADSTRTSEPTVTNGSNSSGFNKRNRRRQHQQHNNRAVPEEHDDHRRLCDEVQTLKLELEKLKLEKQKAELVKDISESGTVRMKRVSLPVSLDSIRSHSDEDDDSENDVTFTVRPDYPVTEYHTGSLGIERFKRSESRPEQITKYVGRQPSYRHHTENVNRDATVEVTTKHQTFDGGIITRKAKIAYSVPQEDVPAVASRMFKAVTSAITSTGSGIMDAITNLKTPKIMNSVYITPEPVFEEDRRDKKYDNATLIRLARENLDTPRTNIFTDEEYNYFHGVDEHGEPIARDLATLMDMTKGTTTLRQVLECYAKVKNRTLEEIARHSQIIYWLTDRECNPEIVGRMIDYYRPDQFLLVRDVPNVYYPKTSFPVAKCKPITWENLIMRFLP